MIFLAKYWQAILGGAIIAVLAIILYIRTDQRDDARAQYKAERDAAILFAERVRSKAEEISRRFAENARRVEAEQNAISQESSREYQVRIAELRARVDRLRANQGGANTRGARSARVPGLPEPASGSDVAARENRLPPADAVIATEQAIRLEELQRWVRRQVEVRR